MSRTAVWDGFLEWFSKKYPDVIVSELSGKKMKAIETEYLEEATEEVEVNEYGEIVSKRENEKGVKLKPHTFYGPKWAVELLDRLDKDQLKELLRTAALITDPLSQELMKKASSEGP